MLGWAEFSRWGGAGLRGNGRGVSEQLLGALGIPEAVDVRHHIRIPTLAKWGRRQRQATVFWACSQGTLDAGGCLSEISARGREGRQARWRGGYLL